MQFLSGILQKIDLLAAPDFWHFITVIGPSHKARRRMWVRMKEVNRINNWFLIWLLFGSRYSKNWSCLVNWDNHLLWDNGLYPVTCILNKHWLASSQAGSRGRAMRTREFWEREKTQPAVVTQPQKNQDSQMWLPRQKKIPSYVANTWAIISHKS